jgi:hypothetical protein
MKLLVKLHYSKLVVLFGTQNHATGSIANFLWKSIQV